MLNIGISTTYYAHLPTVEAAALAAEAGSVEKDYAENILPLPVDQRYDAHDMQRILDALFELTTG